MNNAVILYESRLGTTKRFAENISAFLINKNINTSVSAVESLQKSVISGADIVFLGCWTNGLMLMFQHPPGKWKNALKEVNELKNKKVVLFTTYNILTGSMFKKMEQTLRQYNIEVVGRLKSRKGFLDEQMQHEMDQLIWLYSK